jgi:uncharacterized protein
VKTTNRTGLSSRERPAAWRRTLLALTVLVLLVLPGCLAGDGGGRTLDEIIQQAIEEAEAQRGGGTGRTEGDPGAEAPIETEGGNQSFDYSQYQQTIETALGLLEEYWTETLPSLGARYSGPAGYYYYRSDEETGPDCGGQPAPPRNAFYCPRGDFIAWDESGLMIPFYVSGGDFAAAFVLAHEFGHAMQVRLPEQEQVGVLRELQADCFAGSWSRWVAQRGLLEAGDLDEATLAVFSARDMPGTEWTDPRAHGSGFERTRAFGDGYELGAASCYPAPAEEWLLSQH